MVTVKSFTHFSAPLFFSASNVVEVEVTFHSFCMAAYLSKLWICFTEIKKKKEIKFNYKRVEGVQVSAA